jgi:DNA-binding transcriptional LysR family regulator
MDIPHIKYRQLKAFCLAVESGTFKQAAQRLAVTPPSLSVLIRELESDTGVALFERGLRRCLPSPAGRAFFEQIRGPLSHLEEAYRHVRGVGAGVHGLLSVAALPSLAAGAITERLAAFQRTYPGVRISLSERKHDQVLAAIQLGEAEIGIGSMLRPNSDLTFEPLFTDRLMFIVRAGHPLLSLRPAWRSLDRFDLVLMTGGPAEHGLLQNKVKPGQVHEVEQADTALAMVRNGMGVTVLPSSILRSANLKGLEWRAIQGPLALRRLGVIRKRSLPLSAAAAAFVATLGDLGDAQGTRE